MRLKAAISAFICLHMHDDLLCGALRLSSGKSVKLEMQSVDLFNEMELNGIAFDVNEAKILISKVTENIFHFFFFYFSFKNIPNYAL